MLAMRNALFTKAFEMEQQKSLLDSINSDKWEEPPGQEKYFVNIGLDHPSIGPRITEVIFSFHSYPKKFDDGTCYFTFRVKCPLLFGYKIDESCVSIFIVAPSDRMRDYPKKKEELLKDFIKRWNTD